MSVISSIHSSVACKQACVVNGPLWSASQRLAWWRLVVHKDSSAARHQREWLSTCRRDVRPTAGKCNKREKRRNDPPRKQRRIKASRKMKMGIIEAGWVEEVGGGRWEKDWILVHWQRCRCLCISSTPQWRAENRGTKRRMEGVWGQMERAVMDGRRMDGRRSTTPSVNELTARDEPQRASQCVNTGLCLPPLPTINSAMFVCVEEWTLMRGQREGGETKTRNELQDSLDLKI